MRNVNPEFHPSETELLLALEGELSVRRAAYVRKHLELCWKCRVTTQHQKDGICAWVTYDQQSAQSGPRPPDEWRHFPRRLEETASACERSVRGSMFQAAKSRPFWFSLGPVALLVLLGVVVPLFHPPILSAEQFLRRVAAAPRKTEPHFVRISSGHRSITRRMGFSNAATAKPDSQEIEFKTIFLASGLNWLDPLDAQTFIDWHAHLQSKQDSVIQRNDEVELRTRTSNGPIREAAFVVTATGWRPLRKEFRLENGSLLTIAEVYPPAEPRIVEAKPIHKAPVAPVSIPEEPRPSETELLRAEIQARVALHSEQADLGEPLEVSRSAEGAIAVTGIESNPEKLVRLHAALANIPAVDDRISPEAPSSSLHEARPYSSGQAIASPTSRASVRERMAKAFPDSANRTEHVNSILADSQDLLIRGWALQRLAERYTPLVEKQLDAESSALLRTLVMDHTAALLKTVANLEPSISLLATESLVPDTPADAVAGAGDWRSKVQAVFRLVQQSDHLCNHMIFGPEDATSGIEAEARQLQQVYHAIRTELGKLEPPGAR